MNALRPVSDGTSSPIPRRACSPSSNWPEPTSDRGQLLGARRAASRLLRHIDASALPGLPAQSPQRLSEIRADGLAVLAIANDGLERPDGAVSVERSIDAYRALLASGCSLRPPALAAYGSVLILDGRFDEAHEPLVHALEAGEEVALGLVRRACDALLASGQTVGAIGLLQSLHERYPTAAEIAADLASAFAASGDPESAAEAHVAAGALLADRGRYVESLEHFAKATTAVPDHPLAHLGRCQALVALGQTPEGLAALDELRQAQPYLAGAHAVTAVGLALERRLDEALAAVDSALRSFPTIHG